MMDLIQLDGSFVLVPRNSSGIWAQICTDKGLSDRAFQCRGCKFASNSGNLHNLQICLQGSGETSSFFIWRLERS
uniref:Uncharacterized protein n=1 Tax=Oryza glumipatula TaxID=40148 RepID=A0A0D9YL45_9ORYZ